MKKIGTLLLLLFAMAVTGCSSVKTVGEGMSAGSVGAGVFGMPIAAVGTALSIGADLFSSGGSLPSHDKMVEMAAAKWTNPHTTIESASLMKLKESSSTETVVKLAAVLNRAKEEAKTGRFQTSNKSAYITLMHDYDLGNWITITYPVEGATEAVKMWCNKASEQCIMSTASERVELPTFRESSVSLKKALNGATVSFGDFEAYEPKLSKISCGWINKIYPYNAGGMTFAEVIEKQLMKQVVDANGFDQDSKIKISGKITKIDISIYKPEWNFEMELKSTNGKTLSIKEKYKFEFEFWNNKDGCGQLGDALPAAINDLAEKVANNPGFVALFRP